MLLTWLVTHHIIYFIPYNCKGSTYLLCNLTAWHYVHVYILIRFTGPPNCPTVNTTSNTASLTASIQTFAMTLLPEWYSVEVISYNESLDLIVYNATLKGIKASFHVAPLEPDTVYNISVIPCNMAGCNESCDIHSVQTESDETAGTRGEMDWVHIQAYLT